jgi:hypothetical protein
MKHKFCDAIVAWAEGKPIQFRFMPVGELNNRNEWINLHVFYGNKSPNFDADNCEWRIKPEMKIRKYRVALFFDREDDFYYTANDDGCGNEDFEKSERFNRWLTDWIEYGVEV